MHGHTFPNHHGKRAFPNQMIEQINIALEQKGSGNFSAWVIEACRRRLCPENRSDQIEAI
ncbi:TPA: YlcI/YnfO family protein [Escherichia coli]|uniref:YlcI/YnfO family protein n=1 Tax=Escherichia coli TaxID=562 RepID=UPI001FCE94F4|nr:YlcI/YnfO family protein [Escherichia coli]